MRATVLQQRAWDEFIEWSRRDIKLFHRLVELIDEAKRTPFEGKARAA
jgi:Txe/YoeB family toxin of Txe-Axe toxin-antitoxin module